MTEADRYSVLYDIPYGCYVLQWAPWERLDIGSVDPSADDVPDRLVESQTHSWPVEIRPAHIIRDEKCALDMVCVDGSVVEILTPSVRTLGD